MTLPRMKHLLLAGTLLFVPVFALAEEAAQHADLTHEQALAHLQYIDSEQAFAHMLTMRLVPLLFIVVMTALALAFASRRERGRQELIARYLDKGRDIPAELLPQPRAAMHDMRLGVWFAALGSALGLVLYYVTGDPKVAAWSLIPLFLAGASFLNALFFRAPGR